MRSKNTIKYLLRILLTIVLACIGMLLLFLFSMTLLDYRPQGTMVLTSLSNARALRSDTIHMVSWNIGYAGLNKEMDFFYDGGKQSRTTRQQTEINLHAITQFLQKQVPKANLLLLQEIDSKAHRSYGIDELSHLSNALSPYSVAYGVNYNVAFVPLPLHSPMGQVESGLAIFSQQAPARTEQHAYPSQEAWPTRVFSLDRCFLSARFPLSNGKELVVVNTHNSAFDQGNMRQLEMNYLRVYLLSEYTKGNYVVAGGDWNQSPPLPDSLRHFNTENRTKYFHPLTIADGFLPSGWHWATDGYPTNRFTNEPYTAGHTLETLLDFYIASPNVEIISSQRVDLGYEYSDHNPVLASFVLK